jgi:2-polyprenyl-6-methoxyphenol hydroxylase-like FAD-dependent oxidoreductase
MTDAPRSDAFVVSADVVIIGGGLSGTLAALLLGRIGCRVALMDPDEVHPPEFRAEQLVGYQVERLAQLGLLDVLAANVVPTKRSVVMRAGRAVKSFKSRHYGIRYDEMVNRARRQLPPSVRFIAGQAVDVDMSPDRQIVTLANGDRVDGRLVVLANGLEKTLLRRLGIVRNRIPGAGTLAFGFDLQVASAERFSASVLVALGETPADRIDHLSLFSIGSTVRGNLFSYHDPGDAWVGRFLHNPRETLLQLMPYLEAARGAIHSIGAVQMRSTEASIASGHRRDGIVMIGDAFQTSTPVGGTGVGRLLNDIDLLCNAHIPVWLATDGMAAAKIDQFYNDPVKRSCDAEALRVASYRRALTASAGLRWRLRRWLVSLQTKLLSALVDEAQVSDPDAIGVAWASRKPGRVPWSFAALRRARGTALR